MTIDEAIQLYTLRAKNHEDILLSGTFIGEEGKRMKHGLEDCISENQQLAEWLTELKEAKRLLGLFLSDVNVERRQYLPARVSCCAICNSCKHLGVCDHGDRYEWRYADETLKLIGGNENENH